MSAAASEVGVAPFVVSSMGFTVTYNDITFFSSLSAPAMHFRWNRYYRLDWCDYAVVPTSIVHIRWRRRICYGKSKHNVINQWLDLNVFINKHNYAIFKMIIGFISRISNICGWHRECINIFALHTPTLLPIIPIFATNHPPNPTILYSVESGEFPMATSYHTPQIHSFIRHRYVRVNMLFHSCSCFEFRTSFPLYFNLDLRCI